MPAAVMSVTAPLDACCVMLALVKPAVSCAVRLG
jgi:hypothetical protein